MKSLLDISYSQVLKKDGEPLDQFMNSLKQLRKECSFKQGDAATNTDDFIRDVFINGIFTNFIRPRLLENVNSQCSV